mmetsp:Transcript_17923/g.55670  ORF Transcript_17923/g.55670 Transcript_17923/m.55670 type:complete len:209 (-) Transcript_17923:275-901(-)
MMNRCRDTNGLASASASGFASAECSTLCRKVRIASCRTGSTADLTWLLMYVMPSVASTMFDVNFDGGPPLVTGIRRTHPRSFFANFLATSRFSCPSLCSFFKACSSRRKRSTLSSVLCAMWSGRLLDTDLRIVRTGSSESKNSWFSFCAAVRLSRAASITAACTTNASAMKPIMGHEMEPPLCIRPTTAAATPNGYTRASAMSTLLRL